MGTPVFAVRSLEACLSLGEVVAVVTQPDKPRGRGQEVSYSPVKTLALEKGLTVLQPPKVRGTDFAEQLRALNADVAVVTAYGKILPKDVLEAPRRGSVNVHASLLPRFRGAAPIQWAIAEGDAETGVCLMQMDEGMDTGPVIDRATLPILATDTSATLHDKLALLGGEVLKRSLGGWVNGTLTAVPQQGAPVMAPMIEKEFGLIDFTASAALIERRMRAFTPWPGAFFKTAQGVVKVHGASVGTGHATPGTVLRADPTGIELACGEGSLVITQLQAEGKRSMSAKEFLPGRKLEVGELWPVG